MPTAYLESHSYCALFDYALLQSFYSQLVRQSPSPTDNPSLMARRHRDSEPLNPGGNEVKRRRQKPLAISPVQLMEQRIMEAVREVRQWTMDTMDTMDDGKIARVEVFPVDSITKLRIFVGVRHVWRAGEQQRSARAPALPLNAERNRKLMFSFICHQYIMFSCYQAVYE